MAYVLLVPFDQIHEAEKKFSSKLRKEFSQKELFNPAKRIHIEMGRIWIRNETFFSTFNSNAQFSRIKNWYLRFLFSFIQLTDFSASLRWFSLSDRPSSKNKMKIIFVVKSIFGRFISFSDSAFTVSKKLFSFLFVFRCQSNSTKEVFELILQWGTFLTECPVLCNTISAVAFFIFLEYVIKIWRCNTIEVLPCLENVINEKVFYIRWSVSIIILPHSMRMRRYFSYLNWFLKGFSFWREINGWSL